MTPAAARIAELAGLALDETVVITGSDPVLPSRFHLGEVAAVALAEVGAAAGDASRSVGGPAGRVTTSAVAGACAIISFGLQRVDGEIIPRTNQSNPLVRPYRCGDGRWVFLHGGFPHLADGLRDLLDLAPEPDRAQVAAAAQQWNGFDLEAAIGERDLCGIALRTPEEFRSHPHGAAVAQLPTVQSKGFDGDLNWDPSPTTKPLTGLKVLDMTRVLAGPTCGRTLAALGADVLQVTGPNTPSVPAFVIDTGHGKRRAIGDLNLAADRQRIVELARSADVVVQGYRPGVIERFGLSEDQLRNDGWAGVYGSISCFGPSGPFAHRAGWEQLAQSVSGIALSEGELDGTPTLVPGAATDYTTGLLLAGRIVRAVGQGRSESITASLCQTAALLIDANSDLDPGQAVGIGEPSLVRSEGEHGVVEHLPLGVEIEGLDVTWSHSSRKLGSDELRFSLR